MDRKGQYKEKELLKIAKRDNNSKRPYLLVNPLQGKHYPVTPSQALKQFQCLANLLYQQHVEERLLIIGFAETATAIGAAVAAASPNDVFYLQTTRESIPGAEYLYFSEAHSHATDQKLVKNQLKDYVALVDRIIFVEDEVTTGNTIANLIACLCMEYGDSLKFGIASLLNAMPEESIWQFEQKGIQFTYLLKIQPRDYTALLDGYTYEESLCKRPSASVNSDYPIHTAEGYMNTRVGAFSHSYGKGCLQMAKDLLRKATTIPMKAKRILVLGTEEFVYPPLLFAHCLEQGFPQAEVRFHATTRSPILPSGEEDYPFFNRYQLRSLYEEERKTFVYNLMQYDEAFVFHDAPEATAGGLHDLVGALQDAGCQNIHVSRGLP